MKLKLENSYWVLSFVALIVALVILSICTINWEWNPPLILIKIDILIMVIAFIFWSIDGIIRFTRGDW